MLHKSNSFWIFTAVFVILFNLNATSYARTYMPQNPLPGLGVNQAGLLHQYLGSASNTWFRYVTKDMGYKSIVDARNNGIGYFRISASGFGNIPLDLWLFQPNIFWQYYDEMMDDLAANNVKVIASLTWDIWQLPRYTGEGIHQFITDPNSRSFYLFLHYVWEVVYRYKYHPAIFAWELGNEWNLEVDLDLDKRTGLKGNNITTNELLNFVRIYVEHIKNIDRKHFVSSGFSLPRPSAEHLRRQPEWSPNGPDWSEDSRSEFKKNFLEMNQYVDIASVHFYNVCSNWDCSRRDNERFDIRGTNSVGLLKELQAICDESGKLLFVGEFSDFTTKNLTDPNSGTFLKNVFEEIGRLKIPFSAIWDWEAYPTTTQRYSSTLEPGFTDHIIQKMREVNELFFRKAPEPKFPDKTPPLVVMTFPYAESVLSSDGLKVYAVASDNDVVYGVLFFLDDIYLGGVSNPPYTITIPAGSYPLFFRSGFPALKAVAFDRSGNRSDYEIRLRNPR